MKRRKTVKLSRRSSLTAARSRAGSVAGPKKKVALLSRELSEALEQQTATGEILRVISSSPTDEKPVFDAIARSSVRLCAAAFAVVASFDGELLYFVAGEHVDTEGRQALAEVYPMRPDRGQLAGRAILDRMVIHVTDVTLDPEYVGASLGNRATLSVPMLRTGAPIGTITIARFEPVPFTDQQIELLKTFADQAVIAIENVRLFTELEARNHDLTRALDRETATSEILRVISSSPTDVQPVFDAIVRSAVTLCGAILGAIYRRDGGLVRLVGLDPRYPHAEEVRAAYPAPVTSTLMSCRAIHENAIIQLPDTETSGVLPPEGLRLARLSGFRSVVAVPMRREGEPIGAILVGRPAVGAFPDEQIGLLQAFADQAVIAIENVRLFNETKEALEQQTATSEILGVISRSPTDTHPVFEAIAANAARLCSANDAQVFRVEGEVLRLAAAFGAPSMPAVRQLTRGHLVGRAVIDRKTIHVRDLAQALAEYPETTAARYGVQSALAVPLLREKVALGVIRISRTEIQPFTDKQITLLQTFADQAVIAIENVRLFKELQTRTQELSRSVDQLTALGEVGRAVSSTLDLETVLTTIVTRVVQITGLDGGVVSEYDEAAEEFVQRATSVTGGVLVRALRGVRYRRGEGVLGRTAITREPVQVPDITVPGAYDSPVRQNLIESGIRAVLAVPMLHQERLIGSLGVTRNQPGEFSSETIDLLRTFATQSALAIQNARLFREIEEKSHQLEVASQHKSEFLANMSHELRTPLNAIIGFSEVLTDRMFGELNEKQEEYLKDIYASGTHLLSLINDILDLSKIEAGRMELELSDFHLPTALDNALTLVRERAGRRSIMLQTSVDERLGQIRADERKIRQVVLNLLSNAIKFTPESGRIEVAAVPRDGSVEVSVSDTGVGIAQEDQEAVFEEFRQVGTADKKAEGTGLGLTLCRKFIELHGGRIWVKSQVGVGSTFTFTIAVRRGE